MIQCSDCELFVQGPGGQVGFKCNPFTNVKEPECLQKWQLIKLDMMVKAYEATLEMYRKLAPLQEKMIRHMERELDDIDDADAWKYSYEEEDEEGDEESKPDIDF
jgi:hypothetical protein